MSLVQEQSICIRIAVEHKQKCFMPEFIQDPIRIEDTLTTMRMIELEMQIILFLATKKIKINKERGHFVSLFLYEKSYYKHQNLKMLRKYNQ